MGSWCCHRHSCYNIGMPIGVYERKKLNVGEFKKGIIPWNKGKIGVMPISWNKGKKGTYNLQHTGSFKKGHEAWNKGISHMIDEKHQMWKGEKVKYRGLHMWVVSKLGQPDTCQNCLKAGLFGQKIHWANKSRKYLRELSDWLRLCTKCHFEYDRNQVARSVFN